MDLQDESSHSLYNTTCSQNLRSWLCRSLRSPQVMLRCICMDDFLRHWPPRTQASHWRWRVPAKSCCSDGRNEIATNVNDFWFVNVSNTNVYNLQCLQFQPFFFWFCAVAAALCRENFWRPGDQALRMNYLALERRRWIFCDLFVWRWHVSLSVAALLQCCVVSALSSNASALSALQDQVKPDWGFHVTSNVA